MDSGYQLILGGGLLLLISILSSAVSSRLGTPLLLIFLLLGMLAGVDGPGGIRFYDYHAAHVMGNIALAVILFDGGLRTPRAVFRVGLRPALSLATIGILVTAGITGTFAAWLLNLHWLEGLLLGAIISSTDAAAVFSLLGTQGITLKERVGATLEIESGTNDPMAVFLTIALVNTIAAGLDHPGWGILLFFVQQMGLGALLGGGLGFGMVFLLNRFDLSAKGLYPLLALGGALGIFGLTSSLGGSGFLAVYLAGLIIGNQPVQMKQDISNFHVGLGWLAQIVMFFALGLLSSPARLMEVAPQGLLIALVLMLVARPLAVYLSLLPIHFPRREQIFVSWVGLRGAVPIILAIFPLLANLPNAYLMFNVVFFIVLVSLLIQGWTVAPLARRLGLEVPPVQGPLQRLNLGLVGQVDYELLAYRLEEDSRALQFLPTELPLPERDKPVVVLRGKKVLRLRESGQLQPGDILYVFARGADIPRLNRLFARPPLGSDARKKRFFGEFEINGDALLSDLAGLYNLPVDPQQADCSLAEFIDGQLHTRPVVGDAVTLGPVSLVVKEMEGNQIKRVGLRLGQSGENPV
ncbi:potassium/proton antiporter [Thermithiobacillus plumbiphilus]|uniref:Potassium/proton antiporter n=1 Tax=Thermithiobacillus plumbiphilus TaxID=1729899 RepID=A0ABU9D7B8_9PROT